jgi:hypothetical protein
VTVLRTIEPKGRGPQAAESIPFLRAIEPKDRGSQAAESIPILRAIKSKDRDPQPGESMPILRTIESKDKMPISCWISNKRTKLLKIYLGLQHKNLITLKQRHETNDFPCSDVSRHTGLEPLAYSRHT